MNELILKHAIEKIKLSEQQKEEILHSCTKRRRHSIHLFLPAAACICMLILSVLFIQHGNEKMPTDRLANPSVGHIIETTDDRRGTYTATGTMSTQDFDVVFVNDCDDVLYTDMALKVNFWETHESVKWNWSQVEEYFGREIRLATVPDGLQLNPAGGSGWYVYQRDNGAVCADLGTLQYSTQWNDDGSSQSMADGGKAFSVTVYGEGNLRDYILVPDDEMEPSYIGGVEVMIGHRVMGTLYNENHEPTVTWDLYFAQFEMDGIHYEVVTEGLTVEELVSIVKQLIA